jgi:hypothetical protein
MMLSIFSIFFDSTQFSATDLELKHVQEDHDRLMERHSALLTVSEHLLIFEQAVWFLNTVAINELLCMKNAGAQIAMDFS